MVFNMQRVTTKVHKRKSRRNCPSPRSVEDYGSSSRSLDLSVVHFTGVSVEEGNGCSLDSRRKTLTLSNGHYTGDCSPDTDGK